MFLLVARGISVHKRAKRNQNRTEAAYWSDSETASQGIRNFIKRNLTLLNHRCARISLDSVVLLPAKIDTPAM